MPSYRWLAPPWHPHRRVRKMEPGGRKSAIISGSKQQSCFLVACWLRVVGWGEVVGVFQTPSQKKKIIKN